MNQFYLRKWNKLARKNTRHDPGKSAIVPQERKFFELCCGLSLFSAKAEFK